MECIQDVCEKDEDQDLSQHQNNKNHDCLLNQPDDVDEEGDIQDVCEKDEDYGFGSLHRAAERGYTGNFRMWSANVDVLDTKQNTPLHIATLNGHIDVVCLLLSKNAGVNSRNALGQTSLHLAAKNGHLALAQILLDNRADLDVLDTKRNTPLHIATLNCNIDVVCLLLRKNANVNSRNALGQTSLHLVAKNGHFTIAQILLKCNADVHVTDQSNNTPIHIAAVRGHSELVQLLTSSIEYPHKWVSSLHFAAKCGNTKDIWQLLLNHDENPDATNLYGDTPLHLASENGHFEVVEVLLRNSADARIRNASSNTPLHIAAEMGYAEIVKTIIDHQGEVNAVDGNGDTALHPAASTVVNVLLNQTTEIYPQIRSKLAVSQVSSAELELSQHPIRNKVDVDQTSNQITAEGGNVEIVDLQLSHSSALSGECRGQATTSDLAAEHRHAEIVENLIIQGATVNACNNAKITRLPLACRNGRLSVVDILLDNNATVNVTKQSQETPFYLTARNGKNLMFNDANVNAFNNAKMTPLHLACKNGHTSIVEILLDNHAFVDITKQSKETPLYLAVKNGHAGVSDLLLRSGVYDFAGITPEYKTPLQVAIEEGHAEVAEVILKNSCRLYEKFTKDLKKLRENTKRCVMPAELMKIDGRRVSAELVWREGITPLEILCDLGKDVEIAREAFSSDPKMDKLCLSVYQCIYSEADIAEKFRGMITDILVECFRNGSYSDPIKYKMNLIKDLQFLSNSSKFIVNHQDAKLNTFLHAVQRQENAKSKFLHRPIQNQLIKYVTQLLLENGADFNMKNADGETPLIVASEKGRCDAIQMLFDWEQKLGMKLDLDARDRKGETAMIKAAKGYHVLAVQLLLNHNASVNLYDYYGFTALHAAIYEPNENWVDFDFLCNGLPTRKFDGVNSPEISSEEKPTREEETEETVIDRLQNYLQRNKETTSLREEVVKLLLDNEEINVNALDFKGNTPLDLAVKSSKQINSATFEALKNRGAIRNLLEPEDEAPMDVAKVDERGRNLLHRLILSFPSGDKEGEQNRSSSLMIAGIKLKTEHFRELATATDDKGRTPLHYDAMSQRYTSYSWGSLRSVLLEIGSNVCNAADVYGKTPSHYDWNDDRVQCGADGNIKDTHEHTPKELQQLRNSVHANSAKAKRKKIGTNELRIPRDSAQVVVTNSWSSDSPSHRPVETIRIYSQAPRLQESSQLHESSQEAIWKIWNKKELIGLNIRLSQLKPSVQHFIERLADGIKKKDWRFECKPILVGSADEETKAVISADFDFNFKLINFSQLCDPFPHPLGPKGYFQLRRKANENPQSRSDERFDSFFNLDQCLLTNEVNSRFQIILEEVLGDHNFWEDENLLELNLTHVGKRRPKFEYPAGLCRTLKLRMIHPIDDAEGGFLFVDISIDTVACIQVEDFWPEDPLPVGISPAVKANGSTFVFDRPHFDPSKPDSYGFPFSETFARISFAPLESQIIKESSSLIKAAYIVCKMILHFESKTTYQLKTCLLFCMEALGARNGSETRNKDEITPTELAFWVERIMFCFMEFSRYDVYPCYFMPSFKHRVTFLCANYHELKEDNIAYSAVYDIYLDLCPDDTAIDIPIWHHKMTEDNLCDPKCEQFDREEFIIRLSSRSSS